MVTLQGDRHGRPQVDYTVNPAIGIPAMIFYFLLRNRLDARLEELEEWIEKSLDSGTRRCD